MAEPDPTAPTALEDTALAGAAPAIPTFELDVAQARAEAAVFGTAEAVKIGRYRVIERAGAGGMGVVWSAWDPELGRGVALKLASSGDAAARARARDEGRALARLSHPNVVPIYDVLEHDERVFLVMELVKGETLRAAAAGQTAAQIVRAYRQAGEGLAAAHRAGLIHRDFKPDNAILGADGRVRVLDFGLAHAAADDGAPATIAGTPRYMAPEQRAGAALSAAVDQYALCVALRESLMARGGSPAARGESVTARGESVTARGGVPRWLVPILARGAAEAPADRFPSMDALLAALARDPASRWRRRIAIGAAAIAIVGTIGGFWIGRARPAEAPCGGGPALVAPSWGAARRDPIAAKLAALPSAYAAESVPRVVAAIDRYRDGWLEVHRASCLAHRRGELSAALFDRRTACLVRRRAALEAVAAAAGATTAEALPGLVVAAGELPDIAGCTDDDALVATVAPPPAAIAAAAATIAETLARVDVARDAERLDEAARDAEAAVVAARALGHRPLLARALLARGRVRLSAFTGDRGAADFAAAIHDALVVGDEPTAIEAFARKVWATATARATGTAVPAVDPSAGIELIEAMIERLGARVDFARALLDHNLGSVALARNDRAAARAAFERARQAAAAVTGAGAIELTVVSQGLLNVVTEPDQRAAIGRAWIDRLTALVGANHPRTLRARTVVAMIADASDGARPALEAACRALIALHPGLGAGIAECGYEALWMAIAAGDTSRTAIALAIVGSAARGAGRNEVAFARAYLQLAGGQPLAAAAAMRALGDRTQAEWWIRFYAADGAVAAAVAYREAGRPELARAELAAAVTLYDSIASALPATLLARRRAVIAALTP